MDLAILALLLVVSNRPDLLLHLAPVSGELAACQDSRLGLEKVIFTFRAGSLLRVPLQPGCHFDKLWVLSGRFWVTFQAHFKAIELEMELQKLPINKRLEASKIGS